MKTIGAIKMAEKNHLPKSLRGLRIPAIAAPLYIISWPKLVIAQCKAGIVGSFPALNARGDKDGVVMLDAWLKEITEALDHYNQEHPDRPAAPFAVNQIVHRSNTRLERDLDICIKWKVPIWITSLGARKEVNQAAHAVGGIALHDVINNRHAKKAIDKGADGLIAVATGAGGHGGSQSPFALISEIRDWFDGPLLLSGSIATGRALLAARVAGADLGYIGSPFIATHQANADLAYKQMIVDCGAEDIVTTPYFTGISGNYLKPSIAAAGFDMKALSGRSLGAADFLNAGGKAGNKSKAWRDIWGAGMGIGAVRRITDVEALVQRLELEYKAAFTAFAQEFKEA